MCSMHMLPRRASRRRSVYNSIIEQGAELHLVLEERIIKSSDDINMLEELLAFYHLAKQVRSITSIYTCDPQSGTSE